MSRNLLGVISSLIFLGFLLAACAGTETPVPFFGEEETGVRPEVPEAYQALSNPFANDPVHIAAGERLYEANCAACHGITGEGDGPASGGLNPPPGNLALRHPTMGDPYIYWRISEGGLIEPFRSIMPGWRGLLDENEIWQIISYIRTMVVL
jgi:mono/diheme cytochrome c family protein